MKAVILAGGLGTRLAEETTIKPKPMVEIGGRPILWHILKFYSFYGVNEFIICCGYKGYVIKEYFANYFLHMSDVTFNMKNNEMTVHQKRAEPWLITLVDTGEDSMTGGRLLRVKEHLKDEDDFCFTYGDGLSNVNINTLLKFHRSHKRIATLTSSHPPGRFGVLEINDNVVTSFLEKPKSASGLVNTGFFVLKRKIFDYLESDITIFEKEPLSQLVQEKELMAYNHGGFWQPMDTLRDKIYLDTLWKDKKAPWKVW